MRAGDAEYRCDDVIFAAPTFLAPYVIEGMRAHRGFVYSPWLVANLTLDRWPDERGVPPAWDNVIRSGAGLGYVVATHQSLRARDGVLRYGRTIVRSRAAIRPRNAGCCSDPTGPTGWNES